MYRNTYILLFQLSHDLDYIRSALNQEYACTVDPLFEGSYLLNTDMSYSYLRHIIWTVWPDDFKYFASIRRCHYRRSQDQPDQEPN